MRHLFICLILILFISNASAQDTPLPSGARISNRYTGSISKQELLAAPGLTLSPDYEKNFVISSFRLTRVRKGASPVEINNERNGELTESMRELIESSESGDKIYFEYIKCVGADGTRRSLSAIALQLE